MIIKEIDGDIVQLFREGNKIAHGCNCFHKMGAGVAGQLAKAFPSILKVDKLHWAKGERDKLGNYSSYYQADAGYCFNLYTQYEPGPNVDYGAIVNAFSKLNGMYATTYTIPEIYIPKIGAGIAKGDWNIISKLIDAVTPNLDIIVVNYKAQ
ncbi:hypothetical protein fHeYen901_125 [Yersinia phage fHe-Yen9-01]|uniref:Macro domain-containing protein n=1 Tax=Yersinia phage fHe-Yen9-01 TaxID=1965363 RepID=A0A1V0DXM8_9CAUD|nr:phosphatase [Yersinia phage fHe-Yen9-01]ARB05898.1 hypothetical protein fHeYen901_125 [Yersinia phage fHe-Yen9-01]